MKTFHDHTDLEKANLTEEEVNETLKYELMEKGIIKPREPEYEPEAEPEIPENAYYQPKLKYYSGLGCVSRTAKEAEAFLKLNPLILEDGYPSYRKNVAEPEAENVKVEIINAITTEDYEANKSLLNSTKDKSDRNKKLRETYVEKCNEADEAVAGIWTEWRECKRRKEEADKILSMHTEYIEICEGSKEMAFEFLRKAYDDECIKEAYALLELDNPFVTEVDCEEVIA